MALRMKSLRIESFKAIGDATLHWHPRINILTGPNNSGKTTVLEALALWAECFGRISHQAGKASQKRGINSGDWYLDAARAHHSEVVSVRSPGFDDLFHRGAKELFLSATLEDDEGSLSIPMKIRKARGDNYDFSCASNEGDPDPHLDELNPRLNRTLAGGWPRPFRVYFASPVAAVQTREEFLTPGKTTDMIRQRRSAEVLRNRLFRLYHGDSNTFARFRDDVSRVLTDATGGIDIKAEGDPNEWVRVSVVARTSRNDQFRDISLLGSGSLQVIEILLNLYLEPSKLDLILLDEPDSHIHRDIQRRLLGLIEERGEHVQVFATTHNEALLRNAGWDRVFHLDLAPVGKPREFRPVASEHVLTTGRQHGLLASPLRSALSSVGAETALDFLNALESEHFLLVEGPSDAMLLERIFDLDRFGGPRERAMYWSLNGVEGLRTLPALKVVLEQIRNERSLWAKARVILDRDLLSATQTQAIADAFGQRGNKQPFGIQVHYWTCRTVEATLLSGGPSPALARLIADAGQASALPQLDPHQSEAACTAAWSELGQRMSAWWSGRTASERVLGELQSRLAMLGELFPNKPLSGSDGKQLTEITTFHHAALAAHEYWQSASKDDVREFVAATLRGMGIQANRAEDWTKGPSWFQALVQQFRSIQDFPALKAMRDSLRS
ncbi:MAG: AAA family ATPase [Myxococcota bacterium]